MKFAIAWIFMVFTSSRGCFGITLQCEYKEFQSYWANQTNAGTQYTCIVRNLRTSQLDRTVVGAQGEHRPGKSHKDVRQVYIENQNCPYLPLKIGYVFDNLEIFYVTRSKVQYLTNDDLNGMRNLKIFDVSHNPIKNLTGDFFKGHKEIEIISFYECELNFVGEGALDHFENLQQGHFEQNNCVDYRGDKPNKISALKKELEKCNAAPAVALSGSVLAFIVCSILKVSKGVF